MKKTRHELILNYIKNNNISRQEEIINMLSEYGYNVTQATISRDIKELKNTPWAENTAVSLIEFDDNLNPNIVFYNDVSHLPEEYINKKRYTIGFSFNNNEICLNYLNKSKKYDTLKSSLDFSVLKNNIINDNIL